MLQQISVKKLHQVFGARAWTRDLCRSRVFNNVTRFGEISPLIKYQNFAKVYVLISRDKMIL